MKPACMTLIPMPKPACAGAPNGRMIVYASEVRGRGILAAVSSDGRVKQRFTEGGGDVREPAWGPLIK